MMIVLLLISIAVSVFAIPAFKETREFDLKGLHFHSEITNDEQQPIIERIFWIGTGLLFLLITLWNMGVLK